MSEETKFEQWAIVDVMGDKKYIGKVSEQVIAGCGFVRVDIPKTETVNGWTKLIGTSSICAITPVEEDIARQMAEEADRLRREAVGLEMTRTKTQKGKSHESR